MDVTLTQVVEFLLKYCTGVDITLVLLFLMIADTIYACRWRLQQGKGLISRKLESGALLNIGISFIPFLISYAGQLAHHTHSYLFDVVSIIFGVLFCISFLQSLIANMQISGVKFPGWIQSLVDKYIEPEVNAKETKAQDELDTGKIMRVIVKGVEDSGKSKK